jgi:transposase
MRRNQAVLAITDEQRSELSKWAQSRTLPAGDVFRARLILALAEGESYRRIMTTLQTTAPTISRWKQRFEQDGIDGLAPRHKGSQPRVADAAVQARIARKTQQKPADGSTHWSCRKMAAELAQVCIVEPRILAARQLDDPPPQFLRRPVHRRPALIAMQHPARLGAVEHLLQPLHLPRAAP